MSPPEPGSAPASNRESNPSPFFVEQSKGSSLGYTILPYDPAGAHKDKEPNLIAFRVAVDRKLPAVRLHALDDKGARLAGSERQIRIVGKIPTAWLLLLLALAPLLAMAIVLSVRARAYASGAGGES